MRMHIFKKYTYLMEPHWNHNNDSAEKRSWQLLIPCQNCCIMNLTLLDEFRKPFWCVGSPVSMEPEKTPVSYDYNGEHFLIHYQDSDGQLEMELVWMKEQKQFVLISLVVYVTVGKVNQHFSRDYWTWLQYFCKF